MTKRVSIQVCFIGLGNMGNPMAANLLRAGHHLTVLDLERDKAGNLEAVGASAAIAERSRRAGIRFRVIANLSRTGLVTRRVSIACFICF